MSRAAFLLCLFLAGCSSMSVFQSPGVLPKGKGETGFAGSFIVSDEGPTLINVELHTRRGLGKNWEAGAKLFGFPGLSGGLMGEMKYQLMTHPLLVSADMGAAVVITNDLYYFDYYPMLIMGSERIYCGYRGIFRSGTNEELETQFNTQMHGIFIGYKAGSGPYLRPEIHYYFKDIRYGILIFGLGLQFN
ncbi:MAG: hypothetical protein P9L97_04890 [Candidatus Tenebribacter davisii]|jgi:hypothetical protein|nr:hypothetical protein [Candidatus Tenebribacter davisii]